MANSVVLNNIDHKDLKINTQKSAELGDAVNGTLIFPAEFLQVHKEYPIYFQKSAETGKFEAVAFFGFSNNENLFLTEAGWQAHYVPALIRREPFLIGFKPGQTEAVLNEQPVIMVDLDSKRISKDGGGQAVFKEGGGNTAYLDDVNKALTLVHEGMASIDGLFETLNQLELIEPFVLDIQFIDGSQYKTDRFYTINQEKLAALPDDVIAQMHRKGLLQIAYMVLESMSNIRNLIDKKNALIQASA